MVEEILQNEEVLILPEVMAEVVYVMTKYYNYPRDKVSECTKEFLNDAECYSESLINAIKTFGEKNIDFVDCLLYEYSKHNDYTVFTFDVKLNKLIKQNEGESYA